MLMRKKNSVNDKSWGHHEIQTIQTKGQTKYRCHILEILKSFGLPLERICFIPYHVSNRNHCSFYGKQNKVDNISYGHEESTVATFVSKALHCFF